MIRKIGILTLTATFLAGGYAAATGQYKTIKVYMEKVGIRLNGQQAAVQPDAISYNGTIYVPIRSVGEALGGEVSWDSANRAVDIDFARSMGGNVLLVANRSIYQYMLIEKNQVMEQLVSLIEKKNYGGMTKPISRLQALQQLAIGIGDDKLESYISQMAFSADVIRSGLQSHTGKDYDIAVELFLKTETNYTDYLGERLGETPNSYNP